jgi:hypothetical protein
MWRTVLIIILVLVAMAGWLRPVPVVYDDTYRHAYDSLMAVVDGTNLRAGEAERTARWWKAKADSLAALRYDVDAVVDEAHQSLDGASLDTLQSILMAAPR